MLKDFDHNYYTNRALYRILESRKSYLLYPHKLLIVTNRTRTKSDKYPPPPKKKKKKKKKKTQKDKTNKQTNKKQQNKHKQNQEKKQQQPKFNPPSPDKDKLVR